MHQANVVSLGRLSEVEVEVGWAETACARKLWSQGGKSSVAQSKGGRTYANAAPTEVLRCYR